VADPESGRRGGNTIGPTRLRLIAIVHFEEPTTSDFTCPELDSTAIKEKELLMDEETRVGAMLGINVLLGLWIIFSPFLLGFRGILPAVWNGVGVGLLVAFFSGIRVSTKQARVDPRPFALHGSVPRSLDFKVRIFKPLTAQVGWVLLQRRWSRFRTMQQTLDFSQIANLTT
jgi:SPW repeat